MSLPPSLVGGRTNRVGGAVFMKCTFPVERTPLQREQETENLPAIRTSSPNLTSSGGRRRRAARRATLLQVTRTCGFPFQTLKCYVANHVINHSQVAINHSSFFLRNYCGRHIVGWIGGQQCASERRTKLDFPVEGSSLCIFLSPGKKYHPVPSERDAVRVCP